VHVALLLAGYGVGLSIWGSLGLWFLRRTIVAGRWSATALKARRAPAPARPARAGAEVVALPTRGPAVAASLDRRRAA
jgi:hypothetical protein